MMDLRLLKAHPFSGITTSGSNARTAGIAGAAGSKRSFNKLKKENQKLALQAQKQELCIRHLLKRLQEATNQADEKQKLYEVAISRQSENLDSLLKELLKSRTQLVALRTEIALAKTTDIGDICDEDTIPIKNREGKTIESFQDEIAFLRHALIELDQQYKEIIRVNQNRIDNLENEKYERMTVSIPSSSPDEDSNESKIPESTNKKIQQQEKKQEISLLSSGAGGSKSSTRCGLQEEENDTPRPLLRQSSSLRGFSNSSFRNREVV